MAPMGPFCKPRVFTRGYDCYVTPKNRGLHGQCTVFARSAFSWESSAWAVIALKCVVNFASGQQCQTELRLYFGVCILQKFQQSSHRDGRFACGGYSLQTGAFGLGIEAFLELPAQFYTGGLLDMSIGVYQHIRRSVSCGALHRLEVVIRLQELVGGTGVPLRYNNDKQKKPLFSRGLSVCRLLFNSFSKLKIDENYKEKRRLFY